MKDKRGGKNYSKVRNKFPYSFTLLTPRNSDKLIKNYGNKCVLGLLVYSNKVFSIKTIWYSTNYNLVFSTITVSMVYMKNQSFYRIFLYPKTFHQILEDISNKNKKPFWATINNLMTPHVTLLLNCLQVALT